MAPEFGFLLNEFSDMIIPNHFSDQFTIQKGTSNTFETAHRHNYIQLWYVVTGSFRHILNGVSYTQSAGDFLAIPPYLPHQIDTRKSERLEFFLCNLGGDLSDIVPNDESKHLLFNLTYLRPLIFRSANDTPFIHLHGAVAKQVENDFYTLLEEYNRELSYSILAIRSILIQLLTLVAQEYTRTMPQYDRETFANYRQSIQLALNYADEHFAENISMQDISRIALISERSFLRIFKEITGKTFSAYILHLRIQKAKQLLAKSELSFVNICFECGFFDMSHFFRTFKKITGFTPGAFRKKHQYVIQPNRPNKAVPVNITQRNTPFWDNWDKKQPFLAKIFELEGAPFPSVWELVSDTPNREKRAVLWYLKRGSVISNWNVNAIDVISGELVSNRIQCITDGEYFWWSDLSNYVEQYNLELPQSFIDKAAFTWSENQ